MLSELELVDLFNLNKLVNVIHFYKNNVSLVEIYYLKLYIETCQAKYMIFEVKISLMLENRDIDLTVSPSSSQVLVH